MPKETLFIYEESFFKKLYLQAFKKFEGKRNVILYDTFKNICDDKNKYNMSMQQIATLIKTKRLFIENMPTIYSDVKLRDKIICYALMKSADYDVTVYTKDEELALDLLLNGIKVKNVDHSKKFINIGKAEEKGDIFIYDTCTLITNIEEIDFSKNIHYFSTCVLEELFKTSEDDGAFFKFLYVYNEYPEHVKILNSVSSTQKGGRYSYTDLLILYSAIRSKNEFKDKNITLVTNDRQLFFEAIYLNLFNVTNKINYSGNNSDFEDNAGVRLTMEEEINESDENQKEECVEEDEQTHYETDEKVTTSLNDLLDNVELDDDSEFEESETFNIESKQDPISGEFSFEVSPANDDDLEEQDNSVNLTKKIMEVTKNYTEIPLKKFHRRYMLDEPEIIEHVYNSKFRFVTPVPKKKLDKTFSNQTYSIHPGYWITFKDNPKVNYRVEKINDFKATIRKL